MSTPATRQDAPARDRILDAAYDLFSRRGIRGVGIDAMIEQSGVARMTLYRHFSSKEQLALAFLERREQEWTRDWLQAEVERRADDRAGRLLAIFDVFDAWFRRDDFEGCAFIHVMLETADDARRGPRGVDRHLARIRDFSAGSRATPARGPRRLRAQVAHPDEGLDHLRRRGRRRRRPPRAGDRPAAARRRAARRLSRARPPASARLVVGRDEPLRRDQPPGVLEQLSRAGRGRPRPAGRARRRSRRSAAS